ncbi:hypothetical protein [Hahella sp. HN01]|uniref:hypothetical protein n=1 Tax=Hahella sp. HN01 TaxID=2847262 RepID=UPI001C1E9730|nr:hypothetical protein [Hahella sp. HN01]MBU6954845.1 hypothetical protein [Hahella sp. HN01]
MNKQRIMACLQDEDGSTRDINFTPALFEDVVRFVSALFSEYGMGSLTDQDGADIALDAESLAALFDLETSYALGFFECEKAIVKKIQVFLDCPEDEKCAVELSFFPRDLADSFEPEILLSKVHAWWDILRSKELFIRYEDLSWKHYDAEDLSVFYHRVRA